MPRSLPRRRPLPVAMLFAAVALVACSAGESVPRWDAKSVGESIAGLPFTPVVVNSNLGVERTRLALALLATDQTLVPDAEVTLRLYRLADNPEQDPSVATAAGTFVLSARSLDTGDGRPGSLQTMYTAMVDFDQAGSWGADLDVKTNGRRYDGLRVTMAVQPHTSEPAVGDDAPRSRQKTLADTPNIAELDSATPPNPGLHDVTVADAIAGGKPTLVAFVTPAFCQTRFCGPVLNNAVLPAWRTYGDRVQFIHIEPYDLAAARRGAILLAPATEEWRLRAEPFIAVVDRHGKIATKLEGIIALDEVTEALDAVLAAG